MVALNFDARSVEPDAGIETIPAGWYNVLIDQTEMKPTKNSDGSYLELRFAILDGQYKGRKLFSRLNLDNKNDVAKEIAFKQLSAICHAVNVLNIADSEQLKNIPLKVKVKVKTGGTNPQNGEKYEDQNEINSYKPASYDTSGSKSAAAPSAGFTPPTAGTAAPPATQGSWAPPAAAAPAPSTPAAPPVAPAAPAAPPARDPSYQYTDDGKHRWKAGMAAWEPVPMDAPAAPPAPPAAPVPPTGQSWTPPAGAPAFGAPAAPAAPAPGVDPASAQQAGAPWGPR